MNKPSLLITGAGGFVGKFLLAEIDYSRYETVYCLVRRWEQAKVPRPVPANLRVIEGDLLDPASYESILKGVESVIHMAAATGKVKPKDYFKINAYATMLLLDRCKTAGVKHFLFVSSIAVSFKNKYRYFYALSKEKAEEYVKNSGLSYTIVRPTMIMGKGSPVFAGLSMLAGLPFIPVFGKGDAQIQPVHAAAVARALVMIEHDSKYDNETIELGGPDKLTIKEFLEKIAERRGKKKPRCLRLPMGLTVFSLSILERLVYGLLPLTVGQLASFRNDGTAKDNGVMDKLLPGMQDLTKLIDDSLSIDPPPDIPEQLAKECRVFSRYLVRQLPNNYVMEKYRQCHAKPEFKAADFHDSLLVKLASKGFFLTRMADAYSRFFRSHSLLRRKLAYLMAILEVTPPFFRYLDKADSGGKIGLLIKIGIKGFTLSLHLLFSLIFLMPLQILSKFTRKDENGKKIDGGTQQGGQS